MSCLSGGLRRGGKSGFPALATELVQLKVDVLVTGSNPVVAAAKQVTATVRSSWRSREILWARGSSRASHGLGETSPGWPRSRSRNHRKYLEL